MPDRLAPRESHALPLRSAWSPSSTRSATAAAPASSSGSRCSAPRNGGWLGQGLGQGKGKLFYLPAAHTDFIAAVIAEEAGLLGVLLLVALFAVVVWRGAARRAQRRRAFGCYPALGMTTLIGAQALVNLAVVFGLLPTKGLTLPFVSYGGSSLMTLLAGAGVLLSVSGERGGFLRRPASAVRVSTAPHGDGRGSGGGDAA